MEFEERLELVTRNLQEIITREELEELLRSGKEISVYWGTMPTGSISIAYFFPMLKISDFLKAGFRVKILLADLHAALDGVSWELLDKRTKYYEKAISLMLEKIGVDAKKLQFVRGSEIQLDKKYFEDLLKLSMASSVRNCKKAASEVVKMDDNPLLGNFIYPMMQALDEEHLNADIQYAGADQRKIMVYAREHLPKINRRPRIELTSPIIRGLVGEKMSSSIESTKVDLSDDAGRVEKKIKGAECASGDPDNGIMSLLKHLIMTMKKDGAEKFVVERAEKFGGNAEYSDYGRIEEDFRNEELHPLDLKNAVAKELNLLLKNFREDAEFLRLHKEAYGERG